MFETKGKQKGKGLEVYTALYANNVETQVTETEGMWKQKVSVLGAALPFQYHGGLGTVCCVVSRP